MEINNKDKIFNIIEKDFKTFTTNDTHLMYIVQVLLRKKDGNSQDCVIYQKSINKIDDYDRIVNEAIKIANNKNGRVYITISPKHKESILLKIAQECINLNINNSIQNKSIESVIYGVAMASKQSPM